MSLATDASLTADPGVLNLIPAQSHTFIEIDHEIISTVILLSSAESFKEGCYPPTKSEGYSFGVVRPSFRPFVLPCVRTEPYLSTYWSDLIHSWYK